MTIELSSTKICSYLFYLPGSMYFKFLAKCVNCNGMYRVSALGVVFGAGGDAGTPGPSGHKNARCNSQPTSEIMLAFLK